VRACPPVGGRLLNLLDGWASASAAATTQPLNIGVSARRAVRRIRAVGVRRPTDLLRDSPECAYVNRKAVAHIDQFGVDRYTDDQTGSRADRRFPRIAQFAWQRLKVTRELVSPR